LERVIFKQLILNGTTELQTVDLYGNSAGKVKFECNATYSFDKDIPDTIFSGPTFMIPKSKDQPVLDAICVTPSHVIALQVTVSSCSRKIPDDNSPSSSLYNGNRWKLQNKENKGCKYRNLIENLMALAGVNTTVTLTKQDPSQNDMANHKAHTIHNLDIMDNNTQKPCGVAFSYVVFSVQPYDDSFIKSLLIPNFPWVRFICGKNLEPLLPPEIIDALKEK